jgi:hypothetical protein
MLAYILIMLLLWPLLSRVHSELLKIGLALLPVIFVLLVVRAMVRLVLGSDELEQRIHLIGLAIAATVVSALSLVGGFLAAAGVVRLDGDILLWVWPALVLIYAVGRGWASRRYGGTDGMMCDGGSAMHWRLFFAALALAGTAWIGYGRLSDYQFGLLCGLSASLAAGAAMQAALRWRRTRHPS